MLDIIRRGLALLKARLRGMDLPPDPYAPVRQPRGVSPGGRHSSIALDEPREYTRVEAASGGRDRST